MEIQQENEVLQEKMLEISSERSEILDKMKGFNKENEDLRLKFITEMQDKEKLRDFFNKAFEEFTNQQNFTKKQVERIRNETKVLFNKKIGELEKKHKENLRFLAKNITFLKEEHTSRLLDLGKEAEKIQKKTEKELKGELEERSFEINELKEKYFI